MNGLQGAWVEPTVRWRPEIDSPEHYRRLAHEGTRLVRWPAAPFEDAPTDCFKLGSDEYWIWQSGVGGVRFTAAAPAFDAFPSEAVDRERFRYVLEYSWLPTVYQVWGRQVLHASAVARTKSGGVVVFSGPSGAGKSTLAYALGEREGWQQIGDDTVSFSLRGEQLGLHPIPNQIRLKEPSAGHYGIGAEPVRWSPGPLALRGICFLEGQEASSAHARLLPMTAIQSYPRVLTQAHTLTLQIPEHNRRLMRDYLDLSARVPAYRLTFAKTIDAIEHTLDTLEDVLVPLVA